MHFVLSYAFYFSFMKVCNEMSKKEGITIFQKHNTDFTRNTYQKALGILKVNSRDSDDLSLQEPHLKREAESRHVDLESPEDSPGRPALACARENRDFCVDSSTPWVMISMLLILWNKEREVNFRRNLNNFHPDWNKIAIIIMIAIIINAHLSCIITLNLHSNHKDSHCYYSHFTNGETEA